jgi:hypothetical protein
MSMPRPPRRRFRWPWQKEKDDAEQVVRQARSYGEYGRTPATSKYDNPTEEMEDLAGEPAREDATEAPKPPA